MSGFENQLVVAVVFAIALLVAALLVSGLFVAYELYRPRK
jgi:hypothetical protein